MRDSHPPGFEHSDLQGRILEKLREQMPSDQGRTLPECPVLTSGGVNGVDVVWVSNRRVKEGLRQHVFTIAPESCVELLSPRSFYMLLNPSSASRGIQHHTDPPQKVSQPFGWQLPDQTARNDSRLLRAELSDLSRPIRR